MKPALLALLALVVAAGCGKKATPDEAANELFVEAIELVSKAKSEENTNIPAAIKSYEEALVKVRKIVNEYKKSDLAVKLVSGETLFTGKSMEQIEEREGELLTQFWAHRNEAIAGVKLWEFETGGSVSSSPAIGSDGTVYVGSDDKKLYAINGKTGVKLWEFETGYWLQSSPAIGFDGTVYVGSLDYKLYAIKTDSKGLAKSPWPMRGQNARHTGRTK